MTARASKPLLLRPFPVSMALTLSVGFVDGLLTRTSAWSENLIRPAWHPPRWLFAPVWTLIIVLIACGAALAWEHLRSREDIRRFGFLLAINAALNVAWPALFFVMRRPDLAAIEIVFLWLSIASCLTFLKDRERSAALLFAPYLAWITFAAIINFEIVRLNAPF